jgi:hypothetical protein
MCAAAEYDFSAGFATESHFGDEGVVCVDGDTMELSLGKGPSCKRVPDTGEPDVAVSHEGLVPRHVAVPDALGNLIASIRALLELFLVAPRGCWPYT